MIKHFCAESQEHSLGFVRSPVEREALKFDRPVLGEERWREAQHEQEQEAYGFEPGSTEIMKDCGDGFFHIDHPAMA
jgi:hypothetical protein